MQKLITYLLILIPLFSVAQQVKDTTNAYKKRVLETAEVDFLTSFYSQKGNNAAVTGGVGIEDLEDIATEINISIPLNDDDVLTVNATISAYTSASSSNLDPFSGASTNGASGSPWTEASGASKSDIWFSAVLGYSHSSDDRNTVYTANLSFATEYDYTSFGAGIGLTKLFNQKNTKLDLSANVYLDTWKPRFPTEIQTFLDNNGDLTRGFFQGVTILDNNGDAIDKLDLTAWHPIQNNLIDDKGRNTYSFSLSFSQILSKKLQVSLFADLIYQQGWLANPTQRVYFADRNNFYIGNASDIPNYTSPSNDGVFQLADDIERLPDNRLKLPIGMRLHYYINEFLVLKTYYRYYQDDWDIDSHTFTIELPIKLGDKFTIYPSYRYATQTEAKYFAPFETHVSTAAFYTSDFDLSAFNANQYSFGLQYKDIFLKNHIWKLKLKSINLNYSYYKRSTGLRSNIISLGTSFVIDN